MTGSARMGRALVLSCALFLVATSAAPSPSIWELARTPAAQSEADLLESFELFLLGQASAWDETVVHKALIDYLRGEPYVDLRLEFLAARVRFEATHRSEQRVMSRLSSALERAPSSPLAGQAALDLAHMFAQTGQPEPAQYWYGRALTRLWDRDLRSEAYRGRSQARLNQGQLRPALSDAEHAVAIAASRRHQALARFGLGVVLERSGNLNGALTELRRARQIRIHSTAFAVRSVLDHPDALFVPEFERFYAKALSELEQGMLEASVSEPDLSKARAHFEAASIYLGEFLAQAKRAGHRWQDHASALRRRAVAQLEALGPEPATPPSE